MTHNSVASAAGVSLRQLLGSESSLSDARAESCTHDVRLLRPGDVFIALEGADEDGHDQAVEAVERGASAVICERPLPVFDVPQFIVPDSRVAYGRLCQALVGNPSTKIKVIGVTGTDGKTTTSNLIYKILVSAGLRAGIISTVLVPGKQQLT